MHDPKSSSPDAAARSRVRVRVRFGETDLMGIAHHTSYVVYMEVARVEWMRRRGMIQRSSTEGPVHLPVVDLRVTYRAPARFDEELDVETTLVEVRAASLRFDYRIVRSGAAEVCAEGSTRLACVDEQGRLRRLSPTMVAALARAEA